ncbi:glycosyltransferase family 4 protein [Acetobacter sacchari]|uniref:Glycosyltransferase family 4 protein n=1 Tax=Acetobacter sacchari TaxID=2661687 RepID=A0ABS3M0M3_9PROT|nr:glycosyltransferase family 4 protein [Acetobacter sacchari]
MKIVHVVRQFSPSVGGLEDSVRQLAALQRRELGLDTRVVTLNRVFNRPGVLADEDEVDGVPVRRVPWRGSTRYPLAPSALQALGDADLIHVHAIDFFFDYFAATTWLHRKPMIVSTHGGFFHTGAFSRLKKLWFSTLTRMSIRAYDAVIACSENDADIFRRIARERLMTIENGVNQQKFFDASSPSPRRTIVSFGRFASHKRPDLLFPLLVALKRKNPDWSLVVAGRPADVSTEDLRRMAQDAQVASSVRFVIDPDDVTLRETIGEASYFASLSEHEGFGLAAVEAMSAGLTPLLSPIPPFRRLVAQTGVGVLVDPADLDEAAIRIEAAHVEDEGAASVVRRLAMQGAEPYDWRSVAQRYVNVYQDILRPSGHASFRGANAQGRS